MAIANYLTTAEAARVLNVNKSRVRQLHLAGRLKGRKVGIQLFFDKDEVLEFSKLDRPAGRKRSEHPGKG